MVYPYLYIYKDVVSVTQKVCVHSSLYKTTGPIAEIQTVLESAHRGNGVPFFCNCFFFVGGGGLGEGPTRARPGNCTSIL
jgi:hypothetical protein